MILDTHYRDAVGQRPRPDFRRAHQRGLSERRLGAIVLRRRLLVLGLLTLADLCLGTLNDLFFSDLRQQCVGHRQLRRIFRHETRLHVVAPLDVFLEDSHDILGRHRLHAFDVRGGVTGITGELIEVGQQVGLAKNAGQLAEIAGLLLRHDAAQFVLRDAFLRELCKGLVDGGRDVVQLCAGQSAYRELQPAGHFER